MFIITIFLLGQILFPFVCGWIKWIGSLCKCRQNTKKRQFYLGMLHCSPFHPPWITVNDFFFVVSFCSIWSFIYNVILCCGIAAEKSGLGGWCRKKVDGRINWHTYSRKKSYAAQFPWINEPTWKGVSAMIPFLGKLFFELLFRK